MRRKLEGLERPAGRRTADHDLVRAPRLPRAGDRTVNPFARWGRVGTDVWFADALAVDVDRERGRASRVIAQVRNQRKWRSEGLDRGTVRDRKIHGAANRRNDRGHNLR